jgi:hypothetical protein
MVSVFRCNTDLSNRDPTDNGTTDGTVGQWIEQQYKLVGVDRNRHAPNKSDSLLKLQQIVRGIDQRTSNAQYSKPSQIQTRLVAHFDNRGLPDVALD